MSRPQRLTDEALIDRLSGVFRAVGYEGASLARLAAAAEMERGSLYHRFPGGKQQMAEEVLGAAGAWYREHVFAPLAAPEPPAARARAVAEALERFYAGGRQACLLNLLAQPPGDDSRFARAIGEMFVALIDAFAALGREAGVEADEAKRRAVRVVALLHGSLVLARGTGSSAPFTAFTADLPHELGIVA